MNKKEWNKIIGSEQKIKIFISGLKKHVNGK